MNAIPITPTEASSIYVGEALTTATVLLIFTIVILTVVAYKLFTSKNAKVTLPSGYQFGWK